MNDVPARACVHAHATANTRGLYRIGGRQITLISAKQYSYGARERGRSVDLRLVSTGAKGSASLASIFLERRAVETRSSSISRKHRASLEPRGFDGEIPGGKLCFPRRLHRGCRCIVRCRVSRALVLVEKFRYRIATVELIIWQGTRSRPCVQPWSRVTIGHSETFGNWRV